MGLLYGLLNSAVGALGYVYAWIRGVTFQPEGGFWYQLLVLSLSMTCAGAAMGALAPVVMQRRGGLFVLTTIGATTVWFLVETAEEGIFTTWTSETWILVLVLGLLYGIGLGIVFRWVARA